MSLYNSSMNPEELEVRAKYVPVGKPEGDAYVPDASVNPELTKFPLLL